MESPQPRLISRLGVLPNQFFPFPSAQKAWLFQCLFSFLGQCHSPFSLISKMMISLFYSGKPSTNRRLTWSLRRISKGKIYLVKGGVVFNTNFTILKMISFITINNCWVSTKILNFHFFNLFFFKFIAFVASSCYPPNKKPFGVAV